MLKKAGIVVAAVAACALSVSPLAFAGDFEGDHEGNHKDHEKNANVECDQDNSAKHSHDGESGGLISISDNTVQVPIQACGNQILNNVAGILARQKNEQSD